MSCLCGAIKRPKTETLEDVLERWQMKTWVCISSRRFRRYLAWAREGRYLLYKGRVNVWVEMYMGLFDRVIMPYVDGVHARSPSFVYKDYLLHFLFFSFFFKAATLLLGELIPSHSKLLWFSPVISLCSLRSR